MISRSNARDALSAPTATEFAPLVLLCFFLSLVSDEYWLMSRLSWAAAPPFLSEMYLGFPSLLASCMKETTICFISPESWPSLYLG